MQYLHNLLEYFVNIKVKKVNGDNRRRCITRLQPEIYNLHNKVLKSQYQTNNYAEAAIQREEAVFCIQLFRTRSTNLKTYDSINQII